MLTSAKRSFSVASPESFGRAPPHPYPQKYESKITAVPELRHNVSIQCVTHSAGASNWQLLPELHHPNSSDQTVDWPAASSEHCVGRDDGSRVCAFKNVIFDKKAQTFIHFSSKTSDQHPELPVRIANYVDLGMYVPSKSVTLVEVTKSGVVYT